MLRGVGCFTLYCLSYLFAWRCLRLRRGRRSARGAPEACWRPRLARAGRAWCPGGLAGRWLLGVDAQLGGRSLRRRRKQQCRWAGAASPALRPAAPERPAELAQLLSMPHARWQARATLECELEAGRARMDKPRHAAVLPPVADLRSQSAAGAADMHCPLIVHPAGHVVDRRTSDVRRV